MLQLSGLLCERKRNDRPEGFRKHYDSSETAAQKQTQLAGSGSLPVGAASCGDFSPSQAKICMGKVDFGEIFLALATLIRGMVSNET